MLSFECFMRTIHVHLTFNSANWPKVNSGTKLKVIAYPPERFCRSPSVCFWFVYVKCYCFKSVVHAKNTPLNFFIVHPLCTSFFPYLPYVIHVYPHNLLMPKMRKPGQVGWTGVKCLLIRRRVPMPLKTQMLLRKAVFIDMFPTNKGKHVFSKQKHVQLFE